MHCFLQGDMGVGKSTLLQAALAPIAPQVAGFVTQRLLGPDGTTQGFCAVPLNGVLPALTAPYREGLDNLFLRNRRRDPAVLPRVIQEVEAALGDPAIKLILLDEIGGVELNSPAFMAALRRILAGPKPCAGVLKSAANLAHTTTVYQLGPEYPGLRQELEALLRVQGRLLTVTLENRETIGANLDQYVRAISQGGLLDGGREPGVDG